MMNGFKKWRKLTTISSSSRRLGHYKALLIFDDEKDKELDDFNLEILTVYNTIINTALTSGTLLTRWKKYIAVMIEKIPSNTKINILRLINIYKADYNLILKHCWPHKAIHHAEQSNLLGETRRGTRPMCNAENEALLDECII